MDPRLERTDVAPKTLIIFFGFMVFIAMYSTLLCGMWVGHFGMRSVTTKGLPVQAILENKYIDENTRFWFTYRFTTLEDDTYLSSIQVEEIEYNQYMIGVALPMRYMPDNPNYNALDILHDDIRGDVWGMTGLSLFVILIAVVLAFGWMRTITLARLRDLWQQLQPG